MLQLVKNLFSNKILKVGSMSLLAVGMVHAINLISVLFFSRILTVAEYGRFEVFATYANIFMVILGLDIQGIFIKGRMDHKADPDGYLCSSLLMTTIFAAVVVVALNILYSFMGTIWGLERWTMNLMLLYSYTLFLISIRTADYNFFYAYDKNMILNVSVGVIGIFLSILFITNCLKTDHFLGRILGVTIPSVISGFTIYVGYIKRGNAAFKKEYNIYSLKYGVPLIPSTLSARLLSSSDRVMINSIISAEASGVYSLSYTLGSMLVVATEGMNAAYVPWLYRQLEKEKHEEVTKVQKLYLVLYCGITILTMTVSPEFLKFIGSKEYWGGTKVIIWVVFATFLSFVYTLYVNIEFFYKKTALISLGTFGAAVINIMLNSIFLRKLGYEFAAATTVISYFAMLVFHMMIVSFILKVKLADSSFVMKIVFVIFIFSILMHSLLDYLFLRMLLGLVAIIVLGVFFCYLYKQTGGIEKLF